MTRSLEEKEKIFNRGGMFWNPSLFGSSPDYWSRFHSGKLVSLGLEGRVVSRYVLHLPEYITINALFDCTHAKSFVYRIFDISNSLYRAQPLPGGGPRAVGYHAYSKC